MKKTPRTHKNPRISVNSLTEYLNANPSRRRQIIREQKQPREFQVNYYQPASEAIAKLLCDQVEEEYLVRQIDDLHARGTENDYEKHRWPANAEALDAFLEIYEEIETFGLDVRRRSSRPTKLNFSGVEISVAPEVLLTGQLGHKGQVVGGISLIFSKNDKRRLSTESAKYPGALLLNYLESIAKGRSVSPKTAIVVDIFDREIYEAPRAYKTVMKDVKVACEEIGMWWERI